MSERMKQEGLLQGVTSAALRQHQSRGREALRLEMAGDYAAAARAWQQTANRAPIRSGGCLPGKGRASAGGKGYHPPAGKLRCQPVSLCSAPERRTVSGRLSTLKYFTCRFRLLTGLRT